MASVRAVCSHRREMKTKRLLVPVIIAALTLGGLARGAGVTNAAPPVFHLITRQNVITTDLASNVLGSVRVEFNSSGLGAALQKLDLPVTNLAARTVYSLLAVLGDDTNVIEAATFTTDKKGKARVSYLDPQKSLVLDTNKVLPAALNPLTAVRGIGVGQLGQILAFAWLDGTAQYQYQIKRNLTPVDPFGTAAGSINLKAAPTGANFKLMAGGLTPGSIYRLVLNTNILTTVTSDLKGRVTMIGWPVGAPTLPDLRWMELLDIGSNSVLTTTFPQ